MSRRRALRAVALASLCCVAACGDGDRAERRAAAVNDGARSSPASDLPDALLLRFRESNGVGFDRESWELELLQMGSDVRLRGSVRSGGTSVAIYQPMGPGDFAHLWQWIRTLPYPGWQAHEDESVAEEEWSKSLQIDVVLRNGDRKLGRGTWRRPLVGAAWVQDLEDR
ncbi:MAG: hypothetical protein KC591_17925, partial [Gemmatimonadetes bacterium]|nr:hypothetical protein [Gemmatimonadota bacterium]